MNFILFWDHFGRYASIVKSKNAEPVPQGGYAYSPFLPWAKGFGQVLFTILLCLMPGVVFTFFVSWPSLKKSLLCLLLAVELQLRSAAGACLSGASPGPQLQRNDWKVDTSAEEY